MTSIKMPKSGIALAALFLVLAWSAPCPARDPGVTLAVPVDNRIGVSAAEMVIFLENTARTLMPALKFPLSLIRVTGRDDQWETEMLRLIDSGAADFGFLSSPIAAERMSGPPGSHPIPLATFTVDGSSFINDCLYVRKGDGIGSLAELEGSAWGGSSVIETRRILYDHGIDSPLTDFFGELVPVANSSVTNLGYLLIAGAVDAFAGPEIEMRLNRENNPRLNEVEPLACSRGVLNSIIVARPELDPAIIDRVRNVLFDIEHDPDFETFKFFFRAMKGTLTTVEKEDLDATLELHRSYETRGWTREQERFAAMLE